MDKKWHLRRHVEVAVTITTDEGYTETGIDSGTQVGAAVSCSAITGVCAVQPSSIRTQH